ncbi:hypothetical protein B0H34DRAFT_442241 [Crassisporium funariophilum]|nr:hypothetical protein B0H34DRAFT_442241 [Crassisporium funariophilum]
MFAKLFTLVAASAMVAGVFSTPLPSGKGLVSRDSSHSFDNWGGISSMSGFDNFYGSDNFMGSSFSQTIVTEQEQETVCHSQSIEIIQQRLLVIQEMAKRIISEQICEVETQTITFEQFHASLGSFSDDLRRKSSHQVGYDSGISSHFGDIMNSDGSLSNNDLGFSGHDLGSQSVIVGGSNWNDQSSPSSVDAAYGATQDALQ